MSQPLRFALNRMVAPRLSLVDFLDMAVSLGADAIEIRNDLKGIEIEDGTPPQVVREQCAAKVCVSCRSMRCIRSMSGTMSAMLR